MTENCIRQNGSRIRIIVKKSLSEILQPAKSLNEVPDVYGECQGYSMEDGIAEGKGILEGLMAKKIKPPQAVIITTACGGL